MANEQSYNAFGTVSNLRFANEEATRKLREFVRENLVVDNIEHEARILNYELYWQFYLGNHWRQYNNTMLSFNYVRAFVDKASQFLIGKKAFTLQVKQFSTDTIEEDVEQAIEKFLLYHWNRNNRMLKSYEMLQMGSVSGDLWLILSWDADKMYVGINVADSRHCFPEFAEGDVNKVSKFVLRQPLVKNENKYRLKVTEYTAESITTYYVKEVNYPSNEGQKEKKSTVPNPLKEIPVVHIKNKPVSAGYYSISDVADVLKLNKVYNEIAMELKGIIDYHVAPTTIVTGATMGSMTKKLGRVWSGLPADANVFNLGLDVDLTAAQNYLAMLKTSMHEMSDVPENYLGKIQAISNTSAAALQLTYQPIVQLADMKWLMYGQGIADVNRLIVKMVNLYNPENSLFASALKAAGTYEDFLNDYEAQPIFSYGFPRDKQAALAIADYELRLKLNSRRRILNELGVNNVPELLEEIDEDQLALAELEARMNEISNPPAQEPATPNSPPTAEPQGFSVTGALTTPKDFLGNE